MSNVSDVIVAKLAQGASVETVSIENTVKQVKVLADAKDSGRVKFGGGCMRY